jgi:hypothetical protein
LILKKGKIKGNMLSILKGVTGMVKVTHSAITTIKDEVQDVIAEGKKPFIRLTMGIG